MTYLHHGFSLNILSCLNNCNVSMLCFSNITLHKTCNRDVWLFAVCHWPVSSRGVNETSATNSNASDWLLRSKTQQKRVWLVIVLTAAANYKYSKTRAQKNVIKCSFIYTFNGNIFSFFCNLQVTWCSLKYIFVNFGGIIYIYQL